MNAFFFVPLLASSTCICLRPASRLHVTHAPLLNICAVCTVHRPPTGYHRENTSRTFINIHQRLSAHPGILATMMVSGVSLCLNVILDTSQHATGVKTECSLVPPCLTCHVNAMTESKPRQFNHREHVPAALTKKRTN